MPLYLLTVWLRLRNNSDCDIKQECSDIVAICFLIYYYIVYVIFKNILPQFGTLMHKNKATHPVVLSGYHVIIIHV